MRWKHQTRYIIYRLCWVSWPPIRPGDAYCPDQRSKPAWQGAHQAASLSQKRWWWKLQQLLKCYCASGIFEEEFIEERRAGLEVISDVWEKNNFVTILWRLLGSCLFADHCVFIPYFLVYSQHAFHLMKKHNFGWDKFNGFLLKEFINKVAGHPLVQGERCLHMFLTEVTTISKFAIIP